MRRFFTQLFSLALVFALSAWAGNTYAQGDLCSSATVITVTPGTQSFSADGPSTGGGASGAYGGTNADWYTFTPGTSGFVTISSCADAGCVDSRLALHSGSCGVLILESTDDDGCGCGFAYSSEIATFPVIAGTTYFIEWNDRWSTAAFDWEFTFSAPTPGCTDPFAVNYNPAATSDDGSCTNIDTTCGAIYSFCYDDNMVSGDLGWTLYPNDPLTAAVSITFTSGTIESCCDVLNIYDGTSTADPLLGTVIGAASGTFTATNPDGALYLDLISDGSISCADLSFSPITFTQVCASSTCPNPTAQTSSPGSSSATLGWTVGTPGAGYIVEYGLSGFTPGTGTTVTGTIGAGPTESVSISSLTGLTTYDWYVQEVCTPGSDSSANIGPASFTTTPTNDSVCGAIPVACGDVITGTTDLATLPGDSLLGSATCGTEIEAPGLWYVYTGDDSTVTASLCNSSYDTRINVYSSPSGCSGPFTCVSGNDDFAGCTLLFRSQTTFNAISGFDYYILVQGYDGETGNFELALSCAEYIAPPANDNCAGATPLTVFPAGTGVATVDSNINATAATAPTSCELFGVIQDVWFQFTVAAPDTDIVIYTNTITAAEINLAIYDTCGGAELFCGAPVGGDIFGTLSPGTYYIQYWNHGGADEGSFDILVETQPGPPAYDTCSGAIALAVGPTEGVCGTSGTGANTYATDSSPSEGAPAGTCPGTYAGGDIWFSATVPATGSLSLDLVSSAFSTTIHQAYTGTCGALSPLACGSTYPAQYDGLTPGSTIYFRVWDWGNDDFGDVTMCVATEAAPPPPPANDDICGATPLTVSRTGYEFRSYNTLECRSSDGTTEFSTSEIGEPISSCGSSPNTVWHTFTAPACDDGSGFVPFDISISTENPGTTFDTEVTFYQSSDGSCTGVMTEVDCMDDGDDYSCTSGGFATGSNLYENAGTLISGETYFVKVAHFSTTGTTTGDYEIALNVRVPGPTLTPGSTPESMIDVNWTNANADNYDIYFSSETSTGYGVRWNRTGTSETLNYLDAGTRYDVWVRNECITGGVEYFYSAMDSLTTASSACTSPDPLSCGATTSNSITFNWTSVPGALYYHVFYRPVGYSGYAVRWARTGTSYTMTGLTPSTSYQIWVYAYCAPGVQFKSLDLFCSTAGPGPVARYSEEEQTASFTFDGTEFVNWSVSEIPMPMLDKMEASTIDWSSGELRVYDELGNEVDPFDYVSAVSDEFTFSVIPNVTTNATKVGLFIDNTEEVTIQLYDVQGNLLQSHDLGERSGSVSYELSTSDLPAGMYHVKVQTSSNFATQKLVVVR